MSKFAIRLVKKMLSIEIMALNSLLVVLKQRSFSVLNKILLWIFQQNEWM